MENFTAQMCARSATRVNSGEGLAIKTPRRVKIGCFRQDFERNITVQLGVFLAQFVPARDNATIL